MPRILAIDYGSKRTGLAVTDPLQIIATALNTVHSKDIIPFLKEYCGREEVERFVVGEPKQMNNQPSQIHPQVEQFLNQLKKQFPQVPISRIDERFTSKMAMQSMIENGIKKSDRRKKELVDQISAVIILQSYLGSKNRKDI